MMFKSRENKTRENANEIQIKQVNGVKTTEAQGNKHSGLFRTQ